MFQFGHGCASDLCAECQFVVVAGWSQEAAFEFCHHKETSGFFNLAIVAAGRSEEFCSAHLEVREVVGVVQVSHRVGFDVTDSNLDFVLF